MDSEQREKSACFTGHRIIRLQDSKQLLASLNKQILDLTAAGVVNFLAGGALGFDTLAAEAVLAHRAKLPALRLNLILPCKDQAERWSAADNLRYSRILAQADQVEYVSEQYYSGCMQLRNRRLVDASAHCVCYCYKSSGGAAYTLRYAEQQGVEIYLL